MYCKQGKFRPRFIFALWSEGEFKTGQIELYRNDYIIKFKSRDGSGQKALSLKLTFRTLAGIVKLNAFWWTKVKYQRSSSRCIHSQNFVFRLEILDASVDWDDTSHNYCILPKSML